MELPLRCAETVDPDSVGREYWYGGLWILLTQELNSGNSAKSARLSETPITGQADDPEIAKSHAYELAFSSGHELFHSTLYDWLISRGLADGLLEVSGSFGAYSLVSLAEVLSVALQMRPVYLEAHLKREPGTVKKYQLLW